MGTKENNTKATETANEFTWTLDNTSKIFPIDYSVHELSDKHCWDPRAIRKNLICNPLIKDTLYQLLEGNEEKNGTKRKVHLDNFKKLPLPVEAEAFLKCFFEMRDNPDYKGLLQNYIKRKRPSVNADKFVVDLCHKLYDTIFPPDPNENKDSNAYCRHVLFENSTFASVVLNDLWEKQINKRISTLQSLLSGADTSLQMDILADSLLALDQCIARFSKSELSLAAMPTAEEAIAHMLKQILSGRKKVVRPDNHTLQGYRIKNSTVTISSADAESTLTMSMREAFFAINNHFQKGGKECLEAARSSYLQQLAASAQSQTEQEYTRALSYLSWISAPIDTNQLRMFLVSWTNEWCNKVIHSCVTADLVWDVPSFDLSQYGYAGALITQLVRTYMSKQLNHFDDTINMIRIFRDIKPFTSMQELIDKVRHNQLIQWGKTHVLDSEIRNSYLEYTASTFNAKILRFTDQVPYNISYMHACEFFNFLKSVFSTLYGKEFEIFDDNLHINISIFTQKFCPAAASAAGHFLPGIESMFSADIIEKHLKELNLIVTAPQNYVPFGAFLDACIPLLDGVLYQLLQRIQTDCIDITLSAMNFISSNLTRIEQINAKTT